MRAVPAEVAPRTDARTANPITAEMGMGALTI